MSNRTFWMFVAGLLVGVVLTHQSTVQAASELMFGSYNNAAKAIRVDSTGKVLITTL